MKEETLKKYVFQSQQLTGEDISNSNLKDKLILNIVFILNVLMYLSTLLLIIRVIDFIYCLSQASFEYYLKTTSIYQWVFTICLIIVIASSILALRKNS